MENVAWPPLTVPVPRVADPFLNVTVPVMVPAAEDVMVAVNFTVWPNADGFKEDANVVLVAFLMTSVIVPDVLPTK